CHCLDQTQLPAKVSITFTEPCDGHFHCFLTMTQCVKGQERLRLKLTWQSSGPKPPEFILNLTYDKTVPDFAVSRTSKNEFNISRTDTITDSVLYHRESSYPKQFKSVAEFYGHIEGDHSSDTFVRAILHFVSCSQIFV